MLELSIIHEDNNILVVDKKEGVVMHPFDFSSEETLLDSVIKYAPEILSIDNPKKLQDGRTINLGGIVHKLDRDTSGVVVFAKNNNTFMELSSQFKNHTTKKIYVAEVNGVIEKDMFTVNAPLAREKKSYRQSVAPINFRGELKQAITHVNVLRRFKDKTIVELVPETGRTHQLRAHMAHVGHPIAGDKLYGTSTTERLMLHAKTISFILGNKTFTYTSKTPIAFGV
ncbi:MAG: rRNA synthase [Patescibacteria group bacterium]|nr:rRNA synthase [Patescibacteria group bacterium]